MRLHGPLITQFLTLACIHVLLKMISVAGCAG